MRVAIFELTMPNVGSWDGRWSGSKDKYTIKKRLLKDEEYLIGQNFYYNFNDGWGANIEVRLPKPREKATNKFCNYQWMIKSILKKGKIEIPDKEII